MSDRFQQLAAGWAAAALWLCLGSADATQVTLLRVPDHGIQPQAVAASDGTLRFIYFKGDPRAGNIYYRRLDPKDLRFSQPITVNHRPNSAVAIGTIRGAQLALGRNGRVHVAWNGVQPPGGTYRDTPMLYTRLNDAGDAFEPERDVITRARGLDGGGSVAADPKGNVYVFWHAPIPGNTNGESGRAVFVAHSRDDGRTFDPEQPALATATGACACCGMKALVDSHERLFVFYRAADDNGRRNELLLCSRNPGATFNLTYQHYWKIASCPMSSFFLSESPLGLLAAAETHGRVFYLRFASPIAKPSAPVSPERAGKYPVVIGNAKGEVLLVWVEGTAWGKGGAVAWQVYTRNGQPTGESGRAEGVPAWSMATAFTKKSGDFVIAY